MEVLQWVSVPVHSSMSAAMIAGEPVESELPKAVRFYLNRFPGTRLVWYECTEPGCAGSGCPTFEHLSEIPQEIIDHLHAHAALRH
jgi:hypothetical protein